MTQPLYIVDAFTDAPFAGNPAAVCLLDAAAPAAWMQAVAREMNLSETAFLVSRAEGFDLRWFTPEAEVALCGHATLASAHVLWERGAESDRLDFHTQSGVLKAERSPAGIELDFPALPPEAAPAPAGLLDALGVTARSVHRSRFDYLVELDDEAAVRAVAPDFSALRAVDARGVIVTARAAQADIDFVSRFFAPRVGVNEDPVTGSAHCVLCPFWSGRIGAGREWLEAAQLSARGGRVRVALRGDRVALAGRAVTVLRGELSAAVPPA